MAQALIGVSGTPRNVTECYVGVGGARRAVKGIYVGVNGSPRLAWSGNKYKGVMFACSGANTTLFTVNMTTWLKIDTGKKYPSSYMSGYNNFFYGARFVSNTSKLLEKVHAETMVIVQTAPYLFETTPSMSPIGIGGGRLFSREIQTQTTRFLMEYDTKTLVQVGKLSINGTGVHNGCIEVHTGNAGTILGRVSNENSSGDTFYYPMVYDFASSSSYTPFASDWYPRGAMLGDDGTIYWTDKSARLLSGVNTTINSTFGSTQITIMR